MKEKETHSEKVFKEAQDKLEAYYEEAVKT